jgi:hypothetical protein
MHGGAPGSGAPKGNKNAVRHGFYSQEAKQLHGRVRKLLYANHIVMYAAEGKNEARQLWAAMYALDNRGRTLSAEEADRVVVFYKKLGPVIFKPRVGKQEAAKKAQLSTKGDKKNSRR